MNPVPIVDKRTEASHFVMNETAQGIDSLTHDVNEWSEFLIVLIEDLEMFAMANDPNHPEQFKQMLKRVKAEIETRLKN